MVHVGIGESFKCIIRNSNNQVDIERIDDGVKEYGFISPG